MKPYSSYVTTGAQSVPKMPSHWHLKRLKHLIKLNYGDALAAEIRIDGDIDVYGSNGVVGKHNVANTDAPVIVVGRKGSYGKMNYSLEPAFCIDTAYHVSQSNAEADLRFMFYAMQPLELDTLSQDTGVPGLSREVAYNQHLPLPSIDEQIAIAAYLDAETARIDALIEEKENLGRLLAELRNSVVSDAIERGLDIGAKLVPSGVALIGPLPEHWKPKRLKHLLDGIEQGWSPQCDGRPAELHEWGILKAGACNGGVFRVDEQKALLPEMTPDPSIEIRSGDVLMSRASGSVDLVGSVAYLQQVRPRLMLSDKIFRLKIDESQGTSAEWLAMVFNTQTQRRQIATHVGGSEGLARNIAASSVRELWLPVPPPDEQRRIVEFVNIKAQAIDELAAFSAREIDLLRDLRGSTITDAVLGRIDVRPHLKR
jgi:type I restriction enzyme S subunit